MTLSFNKGMKKRVLFILIAVTVVTVSLAAYYRSNGDPAAPQFTTAAATRGDVVETVDATGTLEAVTTVQVSTQVSGSIESLHADFNSQVKKGQVIARLNPSLLQAQVEQAEATIVRLEADVERSRINVEDTQIKLRRAKELLERQLIPRTDLENAESAARQAEASLKAAQAQVVQSRGSLNQNRVNLSHTIITAPVDGIVISRNVDVGQTVAASMSAPTLFVLAKDLTAMRVSASIDESDIGRIQNGQHVTFKVDAYPTETFTGTVSQVRLQPVVAQNVVSYTTIIDVPNKEMKLKPGMTANVTVEIARADDVIRVPAAALRFRPSQEVLAKMGRVPPAGEGRSGAEGAASAPGAGPSFPAPSERQRVEGSSASRGAAATPGGAQPPAAGQRTPGQRSPGQRGEGRMGGGGSRIGAPRVWILRDGQLLPVRVETGVSDGSVTAITTGELTENDQVITGLAVPSTATTPNSASPFSPFGRGRGPGQGGGRQGGAGGNRGGGRG